MKSRTLPLGWKTKQCYSPGYTSEKPPMGVTEFLVERNGRVVASKVGLLPKQNLASFFAFLTSFYLS